MNYIFIQEFVIKIIFIAKLSGEIEKSRMFSSALFFRNAD